MNIAILILVHKNINQINALLKKLDNNFNIYIHIDKKAKMEPEDISLSPRHRIIKKYPIYWGSYNLVAATYDLMKSAYLDNNDYYLLISGQDFPIKSNAYILNFIESNKYNDFISYEKLPREDWHDGGLERVLYFWENRDERGLFSFILRRARKYQRKISLFQRKMDCIFFGGSNWFNLSKSTMQKVIEFVENNNYLERFKYTRIADEIWLQTLLISKLRMTTLINDSLRYIDWQSGPEHPRTLRSSDIIMIKSSSALFARKFDFEVDPEIIHTLSVDS
jgi:hypothetical protein